MKDIKLALPVISTPKYEIKLPSDGSKISFRPFLVKEEKLLMMAMESEDQVEIGKTVCGIVDGCIDQDIKASELPIFDLEFLFLNLRGKSVGETVEVKIKCEHCEAENLKRLDITDLEVVRPEGHDPKIPLTDTVGMVMKCPSFIQVSDSESSKDPLSIIYKCIDYVYDDKTTYSSSDVSEEDLSNFVDSLNHKQLEKVNSFFETMPRIEKNIDFKCSSCEKQNSISLRGIQDFFG